MTEPQIKKTLQAIVPRPVKALIKKLPLKAEVFVVGGAVRDALLRRKTKDIDIVVRNVAFQTLQRTLKQFGSVELVGRNFGVLKWMPRAWRDEPIDIALPRKDHALGTGGYKDVKIQSDATMPIEQDLQRRDFTVNALAYNITSKKLIDSADGLSDLASKTIRTVGDPQKRFQEDYSRMLRGLRFATQLGFMLEARTAKSMRAMMDHLQQKTKKGMWVVPRETIATELIKMFFADPVRAFDLAVMQHVFEVLIPEVIDMRDCPQPKQFHVEGDVMQHTRLALERLTHAYYTKKFPHESPSALLIFAILLHDIGKPRTITFPVSEKNDRIRYNNHDTIGGEMVHGIAKRLHLSVFAKNDESRHIDADHLAWLVRYHLVGFRNDIERMKPSTIEKYYFHAIFPSKSLLRLQCVDTIATVGQKSRFDDSGYRPIYRTITRMMKTRKKTGSRPLLSGYDIMKSTGKPSGPAIGKLMRELRDAQLSGKVRTKQQALHFIATKI